MIIDYKNLEQINVGSHFLGSGGGGGEYLFQELATWQQLKQRSAVVLPLSSINADDLVLPVGCLGCPAFEAEKMFNTSHLEELINKVQNSFLHPIKAFASLGIGGGHPLLTIFLASYFNIPILDADCFGRCFPSVRMLSTNLASIPAKKAFFANVKNHVFEINCDNFSDLADYIDKMITASGGFCTAVPQILTGAEAQRGLISGTLTQALTIGQIIKDTKDLNEVAKYTNGTFHGIGGVVAVDHFGLPEPFKVRITIKNLAQKKTWIVFMGTEYDLLVENGEIVAQVPDIITFCNPKTAEPYTIRQMHYGMNVDIFTMKGPDIWYTEEGLKLVRSFNYDSQGEKLLCA